MPDPVASRASAPTRSRHECTVLLLARAQLRKLTVDPHGVLLGMALEIVDVRRQVDADRGTSFVEDFCPPRRHAATHMALTSAQRIKGGGGRAGGAHAHAATRAAPSWACSTVLPSTTFCATRRTVTRPWPLKDAHRQRVSRRASDLVQSSDASPVGAWRPSPSPCRDMRGRGLAVSARGYPAGPGQIGASRAPDK